jgi:MFS family permease
MNPWKGLKNLPHNMWVLFAATLINRSGTMVLPFFVLYLTQKLKIPEGDAGFILACYGIGALITAPFVGKLSDVIGSLKVMKFSLMLTGALMFVYPLFTGYTILLLVTLLFSVISEAFRPANLSLIVEVVPPEKRKTAFALNRLAINLGMSIGPVAGGFLTMLDYSIIFYVNGITSLLAGLFLIFSRWDKLPEKESTADSEIKTGRRMASFSLIKDRQLLIFVIAMVPVCMIFFQHISTMPLFVVEYLGYTTGLFGLLSAINTVMIIFIEVPLNNAMSRWSDKKSMMLGSLLTGAGFGAMAFAHEISFLAVTIIIWTFGEMIFFPSSANYTADIAPANKRGEYMGFYQMTFSIAFTLGPWAGTQVYAATGPVALWGIAFLFSLISVFMFSRVSSRTEAGNTSDEEAAENIS